MRYSLHFPGSTKEILVEAKINTFDLSLLLIHIYGLETALQTEIFNVCQQNVLYTASFKYARSCSLSFSVHSLTIVFPF